MNPTTLSFFMPFNCISLVAILKLILAIIIVAIITNMAILAISTMAIGIINMAVLGIQLKSKTNSSVVLDSDQSDLLFRHYKNFGIFG